MGWLIVLAVIVCLAILPLGVSARYDGRGALVRLILGPVRHTVFPGKKKAEKAKTEKKTEEKQVSKSEKAPAQKTQGGKLTDFLPLAKIAWELLTDFGRKLRVNVLELKVILAGGDPCDLAVNYGKAWAALGNLDPQLERLFVIKKKDLQIECDFTADETYIFARLDLTITLGRLIGLVFRYGTRAIREYLKIYKTVKGGALQ